MMRFTGYVNEVLLALGSNGTTKMPWGPANSKLCLVTSLPNPLPIINPPGIVFPQGAVGAYKPLGNRMATYSLGLGLGLTNAFALQTWAPAPGDPDSLVTALVWFDNPQPDQFYVYGVLPIVPAHLTQTSRLSVMPQWSSSPDGFSWTGVVWGW